jgi:SpoVK/Ycf46/Vps4 family AAA+-type ATPase
MAAQVIANELKMELYKIDLSQIFDKYVGETEKNIKQIFEQARKSNSILFFDEADSIFNKRFEASNSNDRFANIESSLLLQCIEEYSGISILATNNYNSIDTAFIRRFKYYILFREPDENVRYEIWKSVIPKEAPVSNDVDLKMLSHQFEFTGAVIKNVVLSAAYLAAEEGEAISLIDILRSVKREMFKNNLILTKEKLGSMGYLFEDIR